MSRLMIMGFWYCRGAAPHAQRTIRNKPAKFREIVCHSEERAEAYFLRNLAFANECTIALDRG